MSKSNHIARGLCIALLSAGLWGCGASEDEVKLRTDNNALKKRLEASSSELNEANGQLEQLRTTAAQLEVQNGGLSVTVAKLEADLEAARTESTETKGQLQRVSAERDGLADQAASANERIINLERQLIENRAALRHTRAEAENLTAVNANLKVAAARAGEMEKILSVMKEEQTLGRAAVQSLTAANEQQASRLTELEKSLTEAESAKQELEGRLEQLRIQPPVVDAAPAEPEVSALPEGVEPSIPAAAAEAATPPQSQ